MFLQGEDNNISPPSKNLTKTIFDCKNPEIAQTWGRWKKFNIPDLKYADDCVVLMKDGVGTEFVWPKHLTRLEVYEGQ